MRNYLTVSKTSLPSSDTAAGPASAGPATSGPAVAGAVRDGRVQAVREFNRVYTNMIGLLRGGYLDSPYSLTEARVLFELAQTGATERAGSEISALRRSVDIDAGYLSRILARFEADGLITRRRSDTDARRRVITLTSAGQDAFRGLDQRSAEQIGALLDQLTEVEQQRLTAAMTTIREIAGPRGRPAAFVLRSPRPGDLGWVVQRNGALYAQQYGWDASYEALVARIVADYAGRADPAKPAGSPNWTARRWAACSACARTTAPLSCGCCWSNRARGAWAWESAWPPSAWRSPAGRATRRSSCGPTTSFPRPAASISGSASSWWIRSRITASATTWSGRTGG